MEGEGQEKVELSINPNGPELLESLKLPGGGAKWPPL